MLSRTTWARVLVYDLSAEGMRARVAESDRKGNFAIGRIYSTETIEIEVKHPDFKTWSRRDVPVGTRDLLVELVEP